MSYFAENVRKCWDAYGKQSVFVSIAMESEVASELGKLLSASMDTVGGIDVGYANGLAPIYGGAKRSGPLGAVSAFNGVTDWMNCKTLLFVGMNFIESSLTQTKPFFDAKDAGMHAIAIDPHYSTTATKCDEWIPIEPGTDAALFLGMITQVLDNGWYDEAYVSAHTSLPFLVSQADGSLLRDHAVDPAAAAPEDGAANPFLVWDDEAQAARPAADVESPALEGTFTVDGETYTTVLSLLKKNQQSYDTVWASKVTGIPADAIESLAERYATGGPACIAVGYGGNDKYGNADIAGHAAGLLAAITGNIGRAGGGVGYAGFGYGSAGLGAWPLAEDMKPSTLAVPAFELPYVDSPVKCFIGVGDQIQQRFADLNKLDEWVQGLDFIVYADVYHSTGAQYAISCCPSARVSRATRRSAASARTRARSCCASRCSSRCSRARPTSRSSASLPAPSALTLRCRRPTRSASCACWTRRRTRRSRASRSRSCRPTRACCRTARRRPCRSPTARFPRRRAASTCTSRIS